MCGAAGLPGAPILPQRICKVIQGGKFEKEEPNTAAVAPQACLEPIGVWGTLCATGGGTGCPERREDGRGLPWAPDHELSPWPRQC